MNRKLPEVLESIQLLDSFFSVRKDRLLYPNECIADYYVLTTVKESVAIIATTKDNNILVMQEYRHPVQKMVLGCPGGLVDANEDYEAAAKRELLEETGCTAERFELLGWTYPLPGVLAQKMAIVHAHNTRQITDCDHDDMEIIEWQFMPLHTVKERIRSGDDADAMFCSAFLFFLLSGSS